MRERIRFQPVSGGLVCLWLLVAAAGPVQAQATAQAPERPAVPAGPLSLEQVLDLAEPRSESVAIARAAVTRSTGQRVRARSGLFPQLSASASYDRALASEFEGIFDNGAFGGTGDEPADGDGLEDLPFGRENTWRATLTLSQNVYSGGRIGAQQAVAEAGRESADLGLTSARAQLLFDVTQAYYDAALSERMIAIAEASLQQAGATLQQTQAGFDAGTQPEFEVLRARVARDNQTPQLIRARVNRDVAFLRLKQLLELPADYDLRLSEALNDDKLAPPAVFAQRVSTIESAMQSSALASYTLQSNVPLPDRTAVNEAAAAVRLSEASLRLTEAERKPSVSVNSTYTRVAYPSEFFPAFDRTNWSIGASVTVPILTGGRQRGDEVVARADVDQAQARLQQVQELAALDTRSAWAELLAARAAWEASAGTVQQASRAYEIADVRFSAGVSTQLELSDSRLLLQQAEANRAQAARDLQVARARVALLPDLPLGTGGITPAPAPQQLPATPVTPQAPAAGGQLRTASVQGAQSQAGTR
jgi:outer membrane protein TolC